MQRVMRFTHFVSVPLNQINIQRSYGLLKEKMLECEGVSPRLFAHSQRLHLTILMLNLDSEEKIQKSIDGFNASLKPVTDNYTGLELKIQNLNYIPTKNKEYARVVYIEVGTKKQQDVLRQISNIIITNMLKHKVIDIAQLNHISTTNNQYYPEKLHLTIMNTTYTKSKKGILIQPLINKFSDCSLGVAKVNQLHISTRFKFAEDGFYVPLSVISL